jgi:hypothetical protein
MPPRNENAETRSHFSINLHAFVAGQAAVGLFADRP